MNTKNTLSHYITFVHVFNNYKDFPTLEDVCKELDMYSTEAVRSKAKRYRRLLKLKPELNLPKIIDRSKGNPDDGFVYLDEDVVSFEDTFNYDIKDKKGLYVITAAQYGAPVNMDFLMTLENYCKENNAQLIVMPIKYGNEVAGLANCIEQYACYKDVDLNTNIRINNLPLRPTLVNPLASLGRTGGMESQIFASPKLMMKFVATQQGKLPKVMMTTGAVTYPDYKMDKTGQLAERDHSFSAIVVKIKNSKIFHYRQLIADADDGFYDIDLKYYSPVGTSYTPQAVDSLVMGDWHNGWTCPKVKKATFGKKGMTETLLPEHIIVHDVYDGYSISHHHGKDAITLINKAKSGKNILLDELQSTAKDIQYMLDNSLGSKIVIVKSNHDEHLDRYIREQRFVNDPVNAETAINIMADMLKTGQPALEAFITKKLKNKRVVWLGRDDDFARHGIDLSMHGDMGANGSRCSLRQLEAGVGNTVTGHTHTPEIYGSSWSVGTSTHLKLEYTKGLSSWFNTHCIVYQNGQRQLINIVEGKWR